MRLKQYAIYGLACFVLAACASAPADTLPERRYYVSTVFSWWPSYTDLSLFRKFVDESKQKGMNSVSVDVPWTIEDSDGRFDFTQSDQRIDYAVSRGLSIFIRLNATTLGGSPKWLTGEMLQATRDGNVYKRETDGATLASFSHPVVRDHIIRFARAVAAHYGGRYQTAISGEYPVTAITPAFDLYMESEYYPDADLDYSSAARTNFAVWVRQRYKSINDLNAKWGGSYKSWSKIDLKDAHDTARYLFLESELARICGDVASAVHNSSRIPVGLQAGCVWDNPRRETMDLVPLVRGMDWLLISDAPTYNHAFSVDYARTSAPGVKIASQVDAASHLEGTNGRYFNQGVRAFEHGASAIFLANWDLSNMRDNQRWPFLHFVGRLTREPASHPKPDRAIYVSTWDLINRPKSITDYLAAYDLLSSQGKAPVAVLSDAAISADPDGLSGYSEILLPANLTIPSSVRKSLTRVHAKVKISKPNLAGTLDEYGRTVKGYKL